MAGMEGTHIGAYKIERQLGRGGFGIVIYLAACRARNFPKAKFYFSKFAAGKHSSLAQICMKEGYDPRP